MVTLAMTVAPVVFLLLVVGGHGQRDLDTEWDSTEPEQVLLNDVLVDDWGFDTDVCYEYSPWHVMLDEMEFHAWRLVSGEHGACKAWHAWRVASCRWSSLEPTPEPGWTPPEWHLGSTATTTNHDDHIHNYERDEDLFSMYDEWLLESPWYVFNHQWSGIKSREGDGQDEQDAPRGLWGLVFCFPKMTMPRWSY